MDTTDVSIMMQLHVTDHQIRHVDSHQQCRHGNHGRLGHPLRMVHAQCQRRWSSMPKRRPTKSQEHQNDLHAASPPNPNHAIRFQPCSTQSLQRDDNRRRTMLRSARAAAAASPMSPAMQPPRISAELRRPHGICAIVHAAAATPDTSQPLSTPHLRGSRHCL